ncbi:ABEC1 enzyme, partial [Nicator chloris]|nr:ABEC1 enzyme [Nicator chloris]
LTFLLCFSMYISKRALRRHFDPRVYPHETYLLCELQWGGSDRSWIHWVRNDGDYHAEDYFLEEIFEPRNYNNVCHITLYLSYSPCLECCDTIRDLLNRERNVHIDIRVARVFYANTPDNRAALRDLHNMPRVTIQVMEAQGKVSHYTYCWETFIQPGVYYVFSPRSFETAIWKQRLKLQEILTVSTL